MSRLGRALATSGLLISFCTFAHAQQEHYTTEQSLSERIGIIEKKQDLFHAYLSTHMSGDALFTGQSFKGAHFSGRQFRIDVLGNVNDWLSFRWRQQLNRSNAGIDNIDNLPSSIDVAGIGVQAGDQWSFFFGKQCVAYGGIEFDLNPIEVYEYSDMTGNTVSFNTGIDIAYQMTPRQQFKLQVVNARNSSFEEAYSGLTGVSGTKVPWLYTLNWNGTLSPFWTTRWSYSFSRQGKDENRSYNTHYLALGNFFEFGSVSGYLDFMYSNEGLNSKPLIPNTHNVEYRSLVLKLDYRLTSKWNLFAKGMYETAGASAPNQGNRSQFFRYDTLRTSYGYLYGVEYYPLEDSGLHFFLTYIGRSSGDKGVDMRHYTNRISAGFIYQIHLL